MRARLVLLFALSGTVLSLAAFGEGADIGGIVKGTITIGGKPAPDAVVSVEGVSQSLETPNSKLKANPVVLDQRDMKFIPRVVPVLIGTTVEFPNHDKTFHNVFSASETKKFDLGLYPAGETRSATFDKPGVVRILCNVHPKMEAFVVVKGHRYFSAADQRGNYQIGALPLGKYRVEVWHPELGTRVTPVELVREGEVLGIDIDLKKK